MINKDLLFIPGWISGVWKINKNILIAGYWTEIIKEWKIEGDNLILISQKEKVHDDDINYLIKIRKDHIGSASDDKTVKIWWKFIINLWMKYLFEINYFIKNIMLFELLDILIP